MIHTLLQNTSTSEVLTWAIILILMFGGAIFQWVGKKIKERKEMNGSLRIDDDGDEAPARSLDEIAQQRRQELQRMARQRQQGAGAAAPESGGADPSNMTMAERIARARAKQQYEQRRGAEPAPQQEAPHQRGQDPQELERRRREKQAEAERQAHDRAQAVERQREKEAARRDALKRQRAEQQREAQRSRRTKSQQPAQSQPARPTAKRRPQPPAAAPHETHRLVAEIQDHAYDDVSSSEIGAGSGTSSSKPRSESVGGHLLNFSRLTRRDLQRAWILKEVLDKPVSLRNPASDQSN